MSALSVGLLFGRGMNIGGVMTVVAADKHHSENNDCNNQCRLGLIIYIYIYIYIERDIYIYMI